MNPFTKEGFTKLAIYLFRFCVVAGMLTGAYFWLHKLPMERRNRAIYHQGNLVIWKKTDIMQPNGDTLELFEIEYKGVSAYQILRKRANCE